MEEHKHHERDFVSPVPRVKLGHHSYDVPEFTWRETRDLMPVLSAARRINVSDLRSEDMDVFGEIVRLVVERSPQFRAARDDMHAVGRTYDFDLGSVPGITIPQLAAMMPVVLQQAGLLVRVTNSGEQSATD